MISYSVIKEFYQRGIQKTITVGSVIYIASNDDRAWVAIDPPGSPDPLTTYISGTSIPDGGNFAEFITSPSGTTFATASTTFDDPADPSPAVSSSANALLRMLRDLRNSNYVMHEQVNMFADEFADESDTDAAATAAPYNSTSDYYDNSPVAAAEQTVYNAGSTQRLGNNGGTYVDQVSQGFQLATGATVAQATIRYGLKSGLGPGSVELRIETDSGGEPSGTLADASLTVDIGAPVSWVQDTGTFATPAALSASTQYHLVLKLASDPGSGNYAQFYGSSSNSYANGIAAYRTGGSWAAMAGCLDLNFDVSYSPASAQVQSDAHTALASTGRCVLASYATLGSGTITYAVSRDGGTTFTNATMTTLAVDAGLSYTQYYADVDISAQPAGTAMKIRATITGDAKLYGWGMDYNA